MLRASIFFRGSVVIICEGLQRHLLTWHGMSDKELKAQE